MLNISIVVPNPDEDGWLIPFAKSKVRVFASEWNGSNMSRVLKVEKATILMEVWSESQARVTILSEEPYMESGFLDLLSNGAGSELTYWPAKVEFSPRITNLSGTRGLPNAQGRPIKDGDDSWTQAGCRPDDKLKSITASFGSFGQTINFARTTPTFCSPDAIYARKLMCELFPPSRFTGKLREYVQALYGSLRDDFRLAPGVGLPRFEISTHDFTEPGPNAPPDFQPAEIFVDVLTGYPTTGLFTIAPGKYLLVQVGLDAVTYRTMRPSGRSGLAEKEAYALCELVPSSTVRTAAGTGLPTAADGTPYAYGWHFNERGDEAAVVISKGATIQGLTAFTMVPMTALGHSNTLLRIKLTYDDETKTLSYAVTPQDTGLHLPLAQGKMFVPDYATGTMSAIVPPGESEALFCRATLTAPVYCYFDASDRLEVVYAKNGGLTATPARNDKDGLDLTSGHQMYGSPYVTLPSHRLLLTTPAGFLTDAAGFVSTRFTHAGEGQDYFGAFQAIESHLEDGPTQYYYTGDPPVLRSFRYVSRTPGTSYQTTVNKINHHVGYIGVLVIPFGDAEAVISGFRKETLSPVSSRSVTAFGNNSLSFIDDPDAPGYPPPISWAFAGLLLWTTGEPDDAGSQYDNKVETEMWLYAGREPNLLHRYSATDRGDGEGFNGAPYQRLFAVALAEPIYPYPMTVRTAYFGDELRHDWCMPSGQISSTFLNEWPTDADTPVGWA